VPVGGLAPVGGPAEPDQQAAVLAENLPAVAAQLDMGAAVSIARGRLRVRLLPVRHE
jgi:hypothetical protein